MQSLCQFSAGVLSIDKPAGATSAGAVNRVKRLLPRGTKIGHAGTLDPFATGVLLLLIGKATKLCESLMDQPKQYRATIKLGETTATDDPESEPRSWPNINPAAIPPQYDLVDYILCRFKGQVFQQPPAYSALKVEGKRAYALARAGQMPVLAPRMVNIYDIQRLKYEWPFLDLEVDCGRGTYIRALARDIGEALDTGGHLTQLRRTRVGQFYVEAAAPLLKLTESSLSGYVVPIDEVAHQLRQT